MDLTGIPPETPKQDFSEIKGFYNHGITREIYKELNGVWKWKSHVANQKGKFRQHMSCLAERLAK